MNIFYSNNIQDNVAVLDETESRHCISVLRLERGAPLHLVDGKGLLAECIITIADPREVQAEIQSRNPEYGKLPYHLHIALAPTKSHDRYEWFLEKATEIGVSEITPLICERSERTTIRMARVEKILKSAMKQSRRAYLPTLNAACSFEDFLRSVSCPQKFIAHCYPGNKIRLNSRELTADKICILIGPEGDFTEQEVKMAIKQDCKEIILGDFVLRTETAGIVVCAQISQTFLKTIFSIKTQT